MASYDHLFHRARSLGGRLAFFRHGIGNFRHRKWLEAVKQRAVPPQRALELNIRNHRLGFVADFKSPAAEFLPPESARGRAWIVEPSRHVLNEDSLPPVVVQLAGTGDHGPYLRYFMLARDLAHRGVTSVILENPFYNSRAPRHQRGAKLARVSDLADMGRATVEETCGLLSFWHERGHKRVAIAGVSQGGLHAAMAASLCPFPVSVVAAYAPPSAAAVFTRGCLSTAVDWRRVGEDLGCGGATSLETREELHRILERFSSIENFPDSCAGGSHILLAAAEDQYVLPDSVNRWKDARPDIQVRWVRGAGHVSGVLLHYKQIRAAISDVLSDGAGQVHGDSFA
jgi:pimeloyl-ACP methyl ester carboxylesterase